MIPLTFKKGIVVAPMNENTEEKSPNYPCSKCELSIIGYPFYKNGFEKYYHIHCAIISNQLTVEDIEKLGKNIRQQMKAIEYIENTLNSLSENIVKH